MRFAFFGDVVGRSGRRAITKYVPRLREDLNLDAVVINGENAANGFGITERTANELYEAGADVITLGNHSFDNPGALTFIERETRLLRPVNYPPGTAPGLGVNVYDIGTYKFMVVNVLGRVF
ncbi:MAG: metallophosphoesterase, partial [Acidimicrobiales bacterium]